MAIDDRMVSYVKSNHEKSTYFLCYPPLFSSHACIHILHIKIGFVKNPILWNNMFSSSFKPKVQFQFITFEESQKPFINMTKFS